MQMEYNQLHGITPRTIIKKITDLGGTPTQSGGESESEYTSFFAQDHPGESTPSLEDLYAQIDAVRAAMVTSAEALRFEEAAKLRDELRALEGLALQIG